MSAPNSTPLLFRARIAFFGAAYVGAFVLGAAANRWWRHGPALAAYVALARIVPAAGPRGMLGVALACTVAGVASRVWGSAYLPASSVWSGEISTAAFSVDGPFRYTRNPLYLGTIVLSAGVGLLGSLPTLGLLVAANVVLCRLLARAEEHDLQRAYGEAYAAYIRRVPRFVPTLAPIPASGCARPALRAALVTELRSLGVPAALLQAYVARRPGTPAFWLLLAAGPALAAANDAYCKRRGR